MRLELLETIDEAIDGHVHRTFSPPDEVPIATFFYGQLAQLETRKTTERPTVQNAALRKLTYIQMKWNIKGKLS